jgi:hypothetical protein
MLMFVYGCEKDATGIAEGYGRLNLYVTDAAADYDSVNITFSQVSAHLDSNWITVSGDPVTVDLLKWTNGNKLLIGSEDVPVGYYTQIRIIIDDAEIGVNDTVHTLSVPSGAQTGLKLGPPFNIEEGLSYEMVIDFDAKRSVVTLGPKNNPKGYKLKPHIRVISLAVTGSISGTVTNPKDTPEAYAIQGDDTVTTSLVDTLSGYFMLGFLPQGEYRVTVLDTIGLQYERDGIDVMVGEDFDLGEITLQ